MDATSALKVAMRLSKKLEARRPSITGHLDYIRGEKKQLQFATEKFAEYHGTRFKDFTDNWCEPVLSAPAERMNIVGLRIGEDTRTADQDMSRVWSENDLDRQSSEAWMLGLGTGWTYALVWGNAEDEETPRVTFEHPSTMIVESDPETGRIRYALKQWTVDDGMEWATLYTADEVFKYERKARVTNGKTSSGLIVPEGFNIADLWDPRQPESDDTWPLPNPMGRVPVEEYRNQALLGEEPRSDIAGVEAMQEAVNLVWAYLFTSLDYASLPQRALLNAEIPKVPVLDDAGNVVGSKAVDLKKLMQDRIMFIPGADAKIGQWDSARLDVFTDVLTKLIEHIAAKTRTPAHYLLTKIVNSSAEALTVSETGLVARTNERMGYFTAPTRGLFELIALAKGKPDLAKAIRSTGKVLWADPQYRSVAQKVDAFQKFRAAGMPLEWCVEWFGEPPAEVARIMAMVGKEQADPVLAQLMSKVDSGAAGG